MKMTRVMFEKMLELWSGYDDFDSSVATEPFLLPIMQPFGESPDLVVGDLNFGTGAVDMEFLTVQVEVGLNVRKDPSESTYQVSMLTAGPHRIVRQLGTTPMTVYGIALLSGVTGRLIGYQTLETPLTFDGPAQGVSVKEVAFTFPPAMAI